MSQQLRNEQLNALATTTKSGTISPTNFIRLRDATISVKEFGAVGDGVADDPTAIQFAINSLCASGGTINFPAGLYRISSLSINGLNGIRLKGDVTFSTTLICTSLTGDWITINNSGLIRFEEFEIRL